MKSLRDLLLTAVFLIGGLHVCSSVSFAQSNLYPVSILIPELSLDFSDLDLRDENNRPIKSPSAMRKMESLFAKGLAQSLMQNLTPKNRWILNILSSILDKSRAVFRRALGSVQASFRAWLKESKIKRFVTVRSGWVLLTQSKSPPSFSFKVADGRFLYFLDALLSSTYLLR